MIELVHNENAARIRSIADRSEEYMVARDMIVPYFDGSDWMNELDYFKMIESRESDKKLSQNNVTFDSIHS